MSDVEWAREVFDAGTPGPWRVDADRQISAGGYVSLDDKNADLIALFGSIRGELFAVVERAEDFLYAEEGSEHERDTKGELDAAFWKLCTAIQAHRERTET